MITSFIQGWGPLHPVLSPNDTCSSSMTYQDLSSQCHSIFCDSVVFLPSELTYYYVIYPQRWCWTDGDFHGHRHPHSTSHGRGKDRRVGMHQTAPDSKNEHGPDTGEIRHWSLYPRRIILSIPSHYQVLLKESYGVGASMKVEKCI